MTQGAYTLRSGLALLFGKMQNKSETDQRMLAELQAQLARLLVPMACVNIFNSLVVAYAYAGIHGPLVSFGWAGVICAFGVMQIVKGHKFSKHTAPPLSKGSMLKKAEWASCLLGVMWGGTAFLFASDNQLNNMFLNIIVVGMGAGTAALLGPLCRLSVRFLVCSIPIVFAANLFTEYSYSFETSCLTTALSLALIIGASRNAFHIREMVIREVAAKRAENDLNDAVNASNDAFAFFGPDGTLVLANDRHRALFETQLTRDTFGNSEQGVRTIRQGSHWLLRSVHEVDSGGSVVVHTDVTTMKARERELVDARREAEEADEAKSRFLSTMSHELRTPLNVIIGYSTLMSTSSKVELSRKEITDYADGIQQSGDHLLRLVDDIIDYSKVGLGRFLVEPHRVDLRSVLAKSISLAASFEGIKDLSILDVSVSPKLQYLMVDEFVCQRILISLLSNAFRFREKDPRLVIRARLDEAGRPFISIRDFGPGIAEDELDRVFEAFYQSDGGLARDSDGAGLGLTLCRHLARLHDGDVVLKSRVGVGTTATLVLPASSYVPRELEEVTDAKVQETA